MTFDTLPGEEFLIDLPYWDAIKLEDRWQNYNATYNEMMAAYLIYVPDLNVVNGLTMPTVNGWISDNCPLFGQVRDPFPDTTTDTGEPIRAYHWQQGTQPQTTQEWTLYCSSAAFSLLQGAMYGMMLQMQLFRFTKGYFGRPTEGTTYGKNRRTEK